MSGLVVLIRLGAVLMSMACITPKSDVHGLGCHVDVCGLGRAGPTPRQHGVGMPESWPSPSGSYVAAHGSLVL